jgi:hypothetical protein
MDDFGDDYEFAGQEYQAEMGAYDRVGLPGNDLLGNIPTNRAERAMMDPLQKFRIHVDAVARNLGNWDEIQLPEKAITHMLEKAASLTAVEHKNPTAYVLGYLASGGGVKLTKEAFNKTVKTALPHTEGSVLPPDIIRYARLWESLR